MGSIRNYKAYKDRQINQGTGKGTSIDRVDNRNNPVMGTWAHPEGKGLEETAKNDIPKGVKNPKKYSRKLKYELGHHYYENGEEKMYPAKMHDAPELDNAAKDAEQIFEATAFALAGTQQGTYYGSVRWGWTTDNDGNFKKIPLQVISMGVPSSTFMQAVKLWNSAKTGRYETLDLPIIQVKETTNSITINVVRNNEETKVSLPPKTRVQIIQSMDTNNQGKIKVVDGPHTNLEGHISKTDWQYLKDEVYK